MKKFDSIEKWISSNPSEEEKSKILLLINRGMASKTRREIWEKEQYLRKLQSFSNHCKKMGFNPPKEEAEAMARTKKEIAELQKGLPPVVKKEKKTEVELQPQE